MKATLNILMLLLALLPAAPALAHIAESELLAEQVYDGALPTADDKLVMPAIANEKGRIECVELLKGLMAAPRTVFWREGRKLKTNWDSVPPGTAIATFKKGRYPQKGRARGGKHAAIMRYNLNKAK